MKETALSVRVDSPKMTGDEIQRMAVGILNYQGILEGGEWPQHTVFIDLIPNPADECFPRFVIRMCESDADEKEVEALNDLVGDIKTSTANDAFHFEMRRKE